MYLGILAEVDVLKVTAASIFQAVVARGYFGKTSCCNYVQSAACVAQSLNALFCEKLGCLVATDIGGTGKSDTLILFF
jgi:hypothetical protein